MDDGKSRSYLIQLLQQIQHADGSAAVGSFDSLRSVDARIREALVVLEGIPGLPQGLLQSMRGDPDFQANSRRVRLEALANYVTSALNLLESGLTQGQRRIHPPPRLTQLTAIVPNLEESIARRWVEAQICQHAGASLAAIILMGSILEALLLARAQCSLSDAYKAKAAPRDRITRKVPSVEHWSLSSLIDVATETGWLKSDRGKFGHALRESRNIVHPWAEVSRGANVDDATCLTSWQVLRASINDLLASL